MSLSKLQQDRRTRQMDRILNSLKKKPRTVAGIMADLYLSKSTVRRYILEFKAEAPRRIYVHDFEYDGIGAPAPIYAAGAAKDAEQRKARTKTEKNQAWWGRVKKDVDRHMDFNNKRRAVKLIQAPARRDPLAEWITARPPA